MSRELYQLVAIDKNGKEFVIELNNDNKNNKGTLSFIDSGTTYMQDEQTLINYLIRNGKLNDSNVTFAIKYNYNGVRYLPVIYNNPEIRYLSLNANDEKVLKAYVKYFVDKIDFELCNSNFYNNIVDLNDEIFSQISNGNYLSHGVFNQIRRYYEAFGVAKEDFYYKELFKKDLARSIKSYKDIRTLYIFYQIHKSIKENNQLLADNTDYDIPENLKYIITWKDKENVSEIPQELQKAYKQNGMDGVYALVDVDEIIEKGYKFR